MKPNDATLKKLGFVKYDHTIWEHNKFNKMKLPLDCSYEMIVNDIYYNGYLQGVEETKSNIRKSLGIY